MVRLTLDGSEQVGSRCNVVVFPLVLDTKFNKSLVVDVVSKQKYKVEGCIPEGHGSYTFLDAVFQGTSPLITLHLDATSIVLTHAAMDSQHMFQVIECCSGMGFLGVGLKASGLTPVLGVDMNDRFSDSYTMLQDLPFIHGDVTCTETTAKIWRQCPHRVGLAAGVSCQPYSVLGDQQSGSDRRATSLTGTLETAFHLQCPYVILECVEPTAKDAFFQSEVNKFCEQTGFRKEQIVLRLSDIWPAKRTRNWVVLSSPVFAGAHLTNVPDSFGVAKVGQLLHPPMKMSPSELTQLLLTPEEVSLFEVDDQGGSPYCLHHGGQMMCALHSWGNQTTGCPCGCRERGLSMARFEAKGLHANIQPVPEVSTARHLHPAEVALLSGTDPYQEWGNLRFSLCGLGQLASPLQAIWIGSHVKSMLDKFNGDPPVLPASDLHAYMTWLIARARMIWSPKSCGELQPAIEQWKPFHTLSLGQLYDLEFWPLKSGQGLSMSVIFQTIQTASSDSALAGFISAELATLQAIEDVETADATIPPTVPFSVDENPAKRVRIGYASEEPPAEVLVSCDATVGQLCGAEANLHGHESQLLQCECQGCVLSPDALIEEGAEYVLQVCEISAAHAASVEAHVAQVESTVHDSSEAAHDSAPETAHGEMTSAPTAAEVHPEGESGPLPHLMPSAHTLLSDPHQSERESGPLPNQMPSDAHALLSNGERFAGESGPLPHLMPSAAHTLLSVGEEREGESGPLPTIMPRDDAHTLLSDGAGDDSRVLSDPASCPRASSPVADAPSDPMDAFRVDSLGAGTGSVMPPQCSASPLIHLDAEGLLALKGPMPLSAQQLEPLGSQAITVEDRLAILSKQHKLWGDDEIRWHLNRIIRCYVTMVQCEATAPASMVFRKVVYVDPLIAHGWLNAGFHHADEWCQQTCVQGADCVLMVLPVGGHWVPAMLWMKGGILRVRTWDSQQADHRKVIPLFQRFAQVFGATQAPEIQRDHRMYITQGSCGALAIAFFAHLLFGQQLPMIEPEALAYHDRCRKLFQDALGHYQTSVRPWLWCAGGEDLQTRLVKVLQEQGHDLWSDHSVLSGTFRGSHRSIPRYIWPQPAQMLWPEQWDVPQVQVSGQSPTQAYRNTWSLFEQQACSADPHIPKSATGRALRTQPTCVHGQPHAPLRSSRIGDVEPGFHGASLQHSRWFRQLRRLQSLTRMQADDPDPHYAVQKAELWSSIRRAVGFSPSFAEWYAQTDHKVAFAPATLPEHPPAPEVVAQVYQSFLLAVRSLEKQLKKVRGDYAKLRRDQNPHAIFKDVKQPGPDGVELLVQPCTTQVSEVEVNDRQLLFTMPAAFDYSKPVYCEGQELRVIHGESDCAWVEAVDGIAPGNMVTQMKLKGDIHELFHLFEEEWSRRWNRHLDVPPSQWDDIVNFAKTCIRPVKCPHVALNGALLQQAARLKTKKTSPGLDGVTVKDLQMLPIGALDQLCKFLTHAERTGSWPQQLVAGRVTSLAKVANPESALCYRPITVLSILYRLWGSAQSKSILAAISEILPDDLYGSRPHRQASQIWSQLLWMTETAYEHQLPYAGIVADLQKAFNHLPRSVVLEVGALFGLGVEVLTGWTGAMCLLTRHFQIRNSFSPGLRSVTGYPEGCSLSCIAMIFIDSVFHHWVDALQMPIRPFTYVDDWQMVCDTHELLDQAWLRIESFARQVDMLVDTHKTFTWSVCTGGRRYLRKGGFTVVHKAKTLGAHVQLTKQHTNSALTARARSLEPLWDALRRSLCSYDAKVKAVRACAWPKGLHAAATAKVSNVLLRDLRSGAMRGLGAAAAGANPVVHLSCVEDTSTDPGFWAILQTLRTARDCGDPTHVRDMLARVGGSWADAPGNSITHTLVDRMHVLGWTILPTGEVTDSYGTFDLFNISFVDLVARAERAWQFVVAAHLRHRLSFGCFECVDVPSTRTWLRLQNKKDAGTVRKILNGSFFTTDIARHWNDDDPCCKYCGCEDGRFHRFWHCSAFEECRATMDQEVFNILPQLPEELTCMGWSVRASTFDTWWEYLAGLPDYDLHDASLLPPGVHDVYTDGSCFHQHDPDLRHAGWGIVARGPCPLILAAGVLPGLRQTAFRAELYAVVIAVELASITGSGLRLRCDNEGVVKGLRRILLGMRPKINAPNSDLWKRIVAVVDRRCLCSLEIMHVAAHQAAAAGDEQVWYNNLADKTAVHANRHRGDAFHTFFAEHVTATARMRTISRQVQQVQLQVSRHVFQTACPEEETEEAPVELPPNVPPPAAMWVIGDALPAGVCRQYGSAFIDLVSSWLRHVQIEVDRAPDSGQRWVASYQLFIDFQKYSGHPGPIFSEGSWVTNGPHMSMTPYSFKTRCRWFTRVLTDLLTKWGTELVRLYTRPWSTILCLHTGCLVVAWPQWRLDAIDHWLSGILNAPATRAGHVLASIPVAPQDGRFQGA
eukprot:Skav230728  [mRNA]  locus=scaffold401:270970:281509:+ [translate_table: standard]